MGNVKEYLSIKQAAEFTGISVSTLYKLVFKRKVPVYKPAGRLLFSRAELISWIEQSKQNHLLNF
ncbi:MAG: helix-turn-helix domain-containing protein [bacterium]